MKRNILVFSEDPRVINEAVYIANILKGNEGKIFGVSKLTEDNDVLSNFDEIHFAKENLIPEQWAKFLIKFYKENEIQYLVSPHTVNNNDIIAYVSAKYNLPMISNATSIKDNDATLIFSRQVLGGRGISYIEVEKSLKLSVTVPIKVYPRIKLDKQSLIKEITEIEKTKITSKGFEEIKKSGFNIENADVVVGIGRGFKSKEDIKLAQDLAEVLNGVIGCSRPIAADYGWLPNDLWIGISSKIIRPKLYIAVGISGAPQHVSGIMDSKIIVAINKDKNATIFKYADYGVVADLYQFLPIFTRKIKENLKK
jgi:Electron transfer flavoprotein, alpha subunit